MGFKHATGWGGDGAFSWGERTLSDAFAPVHGWADCEGVCTSKNGDRSLWIDYIFHDASLAPMDRSDSGTGANGAPGAGDTERSELGPSAPIARTITASCPSGTHTAKPPASPARGAPRPARRTTSSAW